MDALRLPPWDQKWPTFPAASGGAWRSAGCCCRKPDMLLSTSPPTTSTPSRWTGSNASLRDYPRARSWPSPTTATSSTTSPAGSSSSTAARAFHARATTRPGSSRRRSASKPRKSRMRHKAIKQELEWVRASPKGRQAKSKARLAHYDELPRGRAEAQRDQRSTSPRAAPGRRRRRGEKSHEGLRRPAALRQSELQAAARRHCRHHRPERRRQDDPVPHDHRPGTSGRRQV